MASASTVERIYELLQNAFSPSELQVIDDSHKHVGHIGASQGGGHFTLKIKSACFDKKPRLTVHREIYAALNELFPNQIHALKIKIL